MASLCIKQGMRKLWPVFGRKNCKLISGVTSSYENLTNNHVKCTVRLLTTSPAMSRRHRIERSESKRLENIVIEFNVTPRRNILLRRIYQDPAKGIKMQGQGLGKISKEQELKEEERSAVIRYINQKIKEQEEGAKVFPALPDYKFWIRTISLYIALVVVVCVIFKKEIDALFEEAVDVAEFDEYVVPVKPESIWVRVYQMLPLRVMSRLWGRFNDLDLPKPVLTGLLRAYCRLYDVDMSEALVEDLAAYSNVGQFFRRPLKPEVRPIDVDADVVCPADGQLLSFGKVQNGQLHQIKGMMYSLQMFLGQLPRPVTDDEGRTAGTAALPRQYQRALLSDPDHNDLYQCVIYLAPGDCHRFFSPARWRMEHRRHFPGELLSVHPKVAGSIPDLFTINERVVLSGRWKHGYLSLTAVGATNVGSVRVYDDLPLDTNRTRWRRGTYYDAAFGADGFDILPGEGVGEFNMGSTVVVLFEAPKKADFSQLQPGTRVRYGERILGVTSSDDVIEPSGDDDEEEVVDPSTLTS